MDRRQVYLRREIRDMPELRYLPDVVTLTLEESKCDGCGCA